MLLTQNFFAQWNATETENSQSYIRLLGGRLLASALAFALRNVDIVGCRARKHCTPDLEFSLGHYSGLLALVSQYVAERREIANVAAVTPALQAGTNHSN
jgi:hypothetical protein